MNRKEEIPMDTLVKTFLFDEPTKNKYRFIEDTKDNPTSLYLMKTDFDGNPPAVLTVTIEESK